MSFKRLTHVCFLTLAGRVIVPFLIGAYQSARLEAMRGQGDLLYRCGMFYLAVTLAVPAPEPLDVSDTLGIDLGILNLATDSTGESFSGQAIEQNRTRHHALRQGLQKRGTKSATRHLKKLSGKEARFKRSTKHVISTRMVQKAQQNHQVIAIEELRHIRSRTQRTGRHSQRARQSKWSCGHLRQFLSSKAALAGVPLHTVTPRTTSRTCSACGQCAKANRKSQAIFCCVQCAMSMNADINAAINLSRASVMVPLAVGRA